MFCGIRALNGFDLLRKTSTIPQRKEAFACAKATVLNMSEKVIKTGELASAVYKNVKMGSELIVTMMPKISSQQLKSDVTQQLADYEKYAEKAKKLVCKAGEEPKEESVLSKWMAKMGIQMNTMTDSTTSHLAEMMIEGSTMNVNDLLRKIHEAEIYDGGSAEMSLAREIVNFEERNIENLKEYL